MTCEPIVSIGRNMTIKASHRFRANVSGGLMHDADCQILALDTIRGQCWMLDKYFQNYVFGFFHIKNHRFF